MGSGTTIGEAHKLGMTALGRDINPVAVEAVRTALGPMDRTRLRRLRELVRNRRPANPRPLPVDRLARTAVRRALLLLGDAGMLAPNARRRSICSLPSSSHETPIRIASRRFRSSARGAATFSPASREIRTSLAGAAATSLTPSSGPAAGPRATCPHCAATFPILDAVGKRTTRPDFRLYGKLVLDPRGQKIFARHERRPRGLSGVLPAACRRSCERGLTSCRTCPLNTATIRARR